MANEIFQRNVKTVKPWAHDLNDAEETRKSILNNGWLKASHVCHAFIDNLNNEFSQIDDPNTFVTHHPYIPTSAQSRHVELTSAGNFTTKGKRKNLLIKQTTQAPALKNLLQHFQK